MQGDPLSFRIGVLWRVVLPIAVVALVIAATLMSIDNRKCRAFCEANGFYSSRFTPQGRRGSSKSCHCLTKDESDMERRIPKGTQVFPWG
jgi:hypothetical protein